MSNKKTSQEPIGKPAVPNYKYELTLAETTSLMLSADYKVRFIAEYAQTKIRYEKLKHLLTRWEAFDEKEKNAPAGTLIFGYTERLERWLGFVPSCPYSVLREQQHQMGLLLHTLELRAAMEGIDLKLVTIKL